MTDRPARIEQVVDVDHFSVQVTLDPALILPALAAALAGAEGNLTAFLFLVLPPDHHLHRQSLADLVQALDDTFTVALTPVQAEALLADLHEATVLPQQCMACESFSVVTVEGLELCQVHAAARDHSVEASA